MKRDYDGANERILEQDIKPGLVCRMRHSSTPSGVDEAPFRDCIVTKIDKGQVHLSRPHVAVSAHGTPWITFEAFECEKNRFLDTFCMVVTARGNPETRLY
jgi:hypothetical protein